MAAPLIATERFRVEHGEGFTMPVVSLSDRRAAGNRLVRFVFQRHLETVLYGRSEGSSGPIWKQMNVAGIGSTTLAVNKASVIAGTITEGEYKELMDVFKSALPADVVDPSHTKLDEALRFHELLGHEGVAGVALKDLSREPLGDRVRKCRSRGSRFDSFGDVACRGSLV